jgi:hypothetical protein
LLLQKALGKMCLLAQSLFAVAKSLGKSKIAAVILSLFHGIGGIALFLISFRPIFFL